MLVLNAANVLLDRIGTPSLAAMGLPARMFGRLRSIVRVAAFVHDLGKCSHDFQQMVRNPGRASPQLFRHEALSLWLCWPHEHGVLSSWLSGMSGGARDLKLALLAAAGHHRKFPAKAIGPLGAEARLFTGHGDFATLLAVGARQLGLETPPQLRDMTLVGGETSEERTAFDSTFRHDTEDENFTAEEHKLLAVAKALVLDADVAGSALFKTDVGHSWLPDALTPSATHSLQQLVAKRLVGRAMRPFQDAVAASTAPVTLVRAGCGSGKTLAAWAWGARQHAGRQFWLCYPTTGTTTEGYRDYVEGADVHAFIEHGRQAIDVDFFGLSEGHNEDETVLRDADRLRAMRQWSADAITCTVDTVLGLLQNQRKGLYAWPGLCRSAVVFDEIHAYDESLFGLLLAWLESLPGIPALLMTASLPADRLQALREVVRRVHRTALAEVDGPAELEQLVRYQRSHEDPDELAQRTLKSGGKVLWVSNTVKQCVAVKSRGPWASGALLYHSRFRYCDRVIRHRDVVEAFAGVGSVLASTTQVAEMSLDLSADLLVTELAPVSALIQRLGRLNRRSTPENPAPVRPFIVVEPEGELPYTTEQLQRAREWLSTLGHGPLSQRALVDAWVEEHMAAVPATESAWISGVYATEPMEVRTGSPGVSVLLERDVSAVQQRPADVVARSLPMGPPPKGLLPTLKRVKYHPVVGPQHVAYSEEEGARWL